MDSLPQEAYDRIADLFAETPRDRQRKSRAVTPVFRADCNLEPDCTTIKCLSNLAVVSHRWQWAAERQTFRHLLLRSTELDIFARLLGQNNRRLSLRQIDYYIVLPTYDDEAARQFEREADRLSNNQCFTAAIRELFRILASWSSADSDDSVAATSASLTLNIIAVNSPTDPVLDIQHSVSETSTSLGNWRFKYSYLAILDPKTSLPMVPIINALHATFRGFERRHISGATLLDMVDKLPNLRDVMWHIYDNEHRYPELRRWQRQAFAQRMPEVFSGAARSLTKLSLYLDHLDPANHAWVPADLRTPNKAWDPLSTAIHKATANHPALQHLHISGTLDMSFFTGPIDHANSTLMYPTIKQPIWQNLRSLSIQFANTTPTREWYFRSPNSVSMNELPIREAASPTAMPPGYNSTEDEDRDAARRFNDEDDRQRSDIDNERINAYQRSVPDENRFWPLLRAFAQTCLQIPRLEAATCDTQSFKYAEATQDYRQYYQAVCFFAPGVRAANHGFSLPIFQNGVDRWRLWWVDAWPLSDDVQDMFRRIQWHRHRGNLLEERIDMFEMYTVPRGLKRRVNQQRTPIEH